MRGPSVAEVHAVEPAVGDGAGVDHREQARVLARRDLVARRDPTRRAAADRRTHPTDSGPASMSSTPWYSSLPSPSKLCARVTTRKERVDVPRPLGDHGDDLLRQARRAAAAAPWIASTSPSQHALARPPPSRGGRRETSGSMVAFERRPTPWPARPTRCSPRATLPGDSTCTTRSTAPMSMPSSIELVATMPRSLPALSSSSISTRCSRAIEPWCARTSVSPASSLSRPASRSHSRRLLANTIVD